MARDMYTIEEINKKNIKTVNVYKKQNPWVSILRIFMCFVVIRDHFVPTGNTLAQKIVGWLVWGDGGAVFYVPFFLLYGRGY